ncbi:unnamed protein product [Rotaria socialis]|uniref:Uncharacterized protein n=1 Tax=Rotaria socialis TaxID=392032 RepID=A0A821BFD2_9BILA|nr:unnamed protein product [Rotaria socialis]
MVISYVRVGGLQMIKELYPYSLADTTLHNDTMCGVPPEDYFSIIRPLNSSNGPPWVGIFGMTILSIWYWCSDQVIVQRALAAKNLTHARAGCIVASYLKFLPLFLMIIPGMVARILFQDRIGCSTPQTCKEICGSESSCTDIAYPLIVIELMPRGLRGLMLACMIAALMTSLTSIFNSSSTIFTIDIWQRFRARAPQWELLIVGRVFTLILVGISILWIPIISIAQGGRLFDYIQSVQSFLAPPICAIYLLTILWKRVNEEGAFWGLICGLVIGLIRFVWEYSYSVPPCVLSHTDQRPDAIKFHYLYFAILLFVLTCLITITVSLLTRPIPDQCLHGLNIFDLNNPVKPTPIPTKSGGWHKADTSFEDKNSPLTVPIQSPSTSGQTLRIFSLDPMNKNGKYCFKLIFSWICGVEHQDDNQNGTSDTVTMPPLATENLFWKRFCNLNGVIILGFCAFLWAFFADYRIDKIFPRPAGVLIVGSLTVAGPYVIIGAVAVGVIGIGALGYGIWKFLKKYRNHQTLAVKSLEYLAKLCDKMESEAIQMIEHSNHLLTHIDNLCSNLKRLTFSLKNEQQRRMHAEACGQIKNANHTLAETLKSIIDFEMTSSSELGDTLLRTNQNAITPSD